MTPDNDPAVIARLWNRFVAAWYEGGKNDPQLQLLRFEPHRAQIWLNENSVFAGIRLMLGKDPKREYRDKVAEVELAGQDPCMESRTVLVTGANRGLGLEFVRQYADDGWRVFAASRAPKAARELKELESRHAGRIAVLALDVTDGESVKAAAGHLRGEPIDLLLNNAGVGGPPGQRSAASTTQPGRGCSMPTCWGPRA